MDAQQGGLSPLPDLAGVHTSACGCTLIVGTPGPDGRAATTLRPCSDDCPVRGAIIAKLREMGHEPTARPCRCQEDPT